jgi:hypothetical protein
MTEDEQYELKNKVWNAVHNLVDEMLKRTPPINETEIRQQLTEQFRFWRRT